MNNYSFLLVGSHSCQDPLLQQAVQTLSTHPLSLAADITEMWHLCQGQNHSFSLIIFDTSIPLQPELPVLPPLAVSTVLLFLVSPDHARTPTSEGPQGLYLDCISEPVATGLLLARLHNLLHIHHLQQDLLDCRECLQKEQKKNEQWQQSIEHQKHYLNMLSIRDGLTGLFNRRHLGRVLEQEMNQSKESGSDLALLLIDIDYFNETNRLSGQVFGDSILNELSARLTQNTRATDICFRFGGGDFIVLLPGMDLDGAVAQAEKLRRTCSDKPFTSGQHARSITVSIGVVTLKAHCPRSLDEFISMADLAMYRAKSEGRNRVMVYSPGNDMGRIDSITLLQDMLARILEKTKTNSIASIQLLTRNITGTIQEEHVQQANSYLSLFCNRLGLPDTILSTFTNALTLHSCYRQLLHRELLAKKETFNSQDRKLLNDMPYKLAELTQHFDYFANERNMLLHQGERFDGTGYPEGLAGEEIPLASRLFNLADALAAMNSDRPHRPRLTPQQILSELVRGAGSQWDPALVLMTIDLFRTEHLLDVDDQVLEQTRLLIKQKIS